MNREIFLILLNILFSIFFFVFRFPLFIYLPIFLLLNFLLIYLLLQKERGYRSTYKDLKSCFEKCRNMEEYEKIREETFHMMIHDLKSPLVFVKGSIELMLEGKGGKLNKNQRDLLEMVLRGCNRVLTMISNILDLDKIKEGKYKIFKEEFFLEDFLEEEVKLYRKKCEIYGKEFIFKMDIGKKRKIFADRRLLSRIFENLISNAIRHSDSEKGMIEFLVNFNEKNNCFYFSIYNNGEKIDENVKKDIFKKYTLSPSSYNKGGSGLGLYFCKVAVELHGGKIWVEDGERNGTKFVIEMCFE